MKSLSDRRLSVLTLGSAQAEDVPRLSPKKLHRLMEMAKKHYDVVLVDTGPVLGSLEAVMVGGQVDSVLLVVSRGTSREIASRAVDRVQEAGGSPRGIVFNRANAEDATYASSSSQRSLVTSRPSSGKVSRRGLPGAREKYHRMGPLVSAVAVSTASEGAENQ